MSLKCKFFAIAFYFLICLVPIITFAGGDDALNAIAPSFSKCIACHSLEEGIHGAGPSLFALDGREAGKVEGFKFSKSFKLSNIIWNNESLNAFLANPQKYVPGNRMPFAGVKNKDERQKLVCFVLNRSTCQ